MSKTATLKGKISLDDTEFNKALRRATDRAKKFAADSAAAVGNAAKASLIGLGAAGVGAGAGLLAATKAAADFGGQLSDTAAITGISAEKLIVLQQAFANAGMSGEGVAGVIAKLQAVIGRAGMMSEETEEEVSELKDRLNELKALKGAGLDPKEQAKVNKEIQKTTDRINKLQEESKGVQKAFKMLGLDQGKLASMDGASQLQAVFEGLGKLGTQAEKMAALRMLRLPPELMVLAKDPNAFKNAETMVGSLVKNLGGVNADKFDRLSDALGSKFGIMFKQVGAGFLAALIDNPVYEQMLSKFEALDLGFIGEAIGERASAALDFIAETIRSGNLRETISNVLQTGFAYAMDYLTFGMGVVFATLGGVMNSIFSENGMTFISGFGAALTGVLVIAAFNFGKILLSAWYALEQKFADSPLGRLMGGLQAAGGAMKMTGTAIPGLFSDTAAKMRDDGYQSFGEGLRKLFDGGDASFSSMKQQEILNDQNIDLLGMSQADLLKASTSEMGTALNALVNVIADAPGKIQESYNSINVNAIRRPATQNAQASLQETLNSMTPEQRASYMRIFSGGAGKAPVPTPVQPTPQRSLMQWTFPGGTNNRPDQSSGDNKAVSVLEQIASLLDRNLSSLQVA